MTVEPAFASLQGETRCVLHEAAPRRSTEFAVGRRGV